MPTTLEKTRSPSHPPSDQPIGECVLRVCNGEHQGKIVRLKNTKCTIGAGPECTLRLIAPGLKPLHCLLIAGSQGVAIRRWSDGTLLNGRPFENAWLQTGDQLRVGPVELEWIGWEKPLVLAERFDAAPSHPREASPHPTESETAEPKQKARRQRAKDLKHYKRLLRARARLVALRRRAKKADRTIEKLNRKLGDLRGQLATLTSSKEGIASHHAETIRRLDEELRQQRQDRRSTESQFEAQSRAWNEERRRLETALDSIGRQLSTEHETSAKLRATVDQARGLNDQTTQQLRLASENLAAKHAQWQQAIRDLETARDQAAMLRNQIDQIQREAASQAESYRRQQGESTATLSQYAAELKELRGWWQEFTAESAAQASENVSVTKTQWESLSHQCERLAEAKRTAEQSLASTQASLEWTNQRVQELAAYSETLEHDSKAVKEDLRRSQESAAQAEAALAELQAQHAQSLAESKAQQQAWNRQRETSDSELATTQAAIDRLRVEWQTQKSLVDAGNARVAQLESEAQSLREQIESFQRQSQAAGEELARSQETARQAESALADLQARHAQSLVASDSNRQASNREHEKAESDLSLARSEMDRLRAEWQTQKSLVETGGTRIAQLESESQSLRRQVESLEREGHVAREEVHRGQEALRLAESSLAEVQTRYSQLLSASEEDRQVWNLQRERLESDLESSKREVDRLFAECQSQKSLVEAGNARLAQLESELRTRQLASSDAPRDAAAAVELEQVRQSLRAAEEERDRTLASEQSLKRQLDEASSQLGALRSQIDSSRNQTEQGAQQSQAQQEQVESLQRCRESLELRVADLTQEIEQARAHLDSVTSEKSELASLCEELRTELLRQKSEAEAAASQWNEDRTRYQAELEAARDKIAQPLSPQALSDDSWQRRELEQLQRSLAGERENLEHEQSRWKEKKEAWETKLQQRSEELERWQADLHDSQQLLVGGKPGVAPEQPNPPEISNAEYDAATNEDHSGNQPLADRPGEKTGYENPLFQNPLFQEIAPEVDRRMGLNGASRQDQGFSPADGVPEPETPAGDAPGAFDSPSGDALSDRPVGQENGDQEESAGRQNQTMVFDRSSIRVPIEQAHQSEDENANGGNDVWQRLNEAGLLRAPEHKPEPTFDSGDSFQGRDSSIHDSSSVRQSTPFPFGGQAQSASPPSQPAPFQPKMPAEDDEESIEDYMARLLKRVRGESNGSQGVVASAPVAEKSTVSQPAIATPSPVASNNSENDSPEGAAAASSTVSEEEYLPKCQAPESQFNLAAMRELAIHSARDALAASANQRRRKSTTFSTVGIMGCVLGAVAIGGLSFFLERYDLATVAAAPCLGACYFAMKLLPGRGK